MGRRNLVELAMSRAVLSDGAMGTMLQQLGLSPGACPELWNIERPCEVRSVHAAYVDAGSQIVSTNTFGGNRVKLGAFGLEDRVAELNAAGIRLAREAAGEELYVMGSIGPTGGFLEPLGDMTYKEAVDVFGEQAAAMACAGADCIVMETFSDLQEARAALAGAMTTGLPCFCTMTFDTNGRTMMGVDPLTAARELSAAGAAGVGANCGLGPGDMLDIVNQMRSATEALIIVQPNAGRPRIEQGMTVYDSTPREMASFAAEYVRAGANIVGGCCGSTPEHIRAIAESLSNL